MTPTEAAIIEHALSGQFVPDDESEQASEALGALRQRDWSVRTLDHAEEVGWELEWVTGAQRFALLVVSPDRATLAAATSGGAFEGATKASARLAAAQAVVAELPDDVRAELGECP